MFFGMSFWAFCWLIVKVIIGVSLIIFIIRLILVFGLAAIAVWLENRKHKK